MPSSILSVNETYAKAGRMPQVQVRNSGCWTTSVTEVPFMQGPRFLPLQRWRVWSRTGLLTKLKSANNYVVLPCTRNDVRHWGHIVNTTAKAPALMDLTFQWPKEIRGLVLGGYQSFPRGQGSQRGCCSVTLPK